MRIESIPVQGNAIKSERYGKLGKKTDRDRNKTSSLDNEESTGIR
jgi:hypothetical protein